MCRQGSNLSGNADEQLKRPHCGGDLGSIGSSKDFEALRHDTAVIGSNTTGANDNVAPAMAVAA